MWAMGSWSNVCPAQRRLLSSPGIGGSKLKLMASGSAASSVVVEDSCWTAVEHNTLDGLAPHRRTLLNITFFTEPMSEAFGLNMIKT